MKLPSCAISAGHAKTMVRSRMQGPIQSTGYIAQGRPSKLPGNYCVNEWTHLPLSVSPWSWSSPVRDLSNCRLPSVFLEPQQFSNQITRIFVVFFFAIRASTLLLLSTEKYQKYVENRDMDSA